MKLEVTDPQIHNLIKQEEKRQKHQLEMIPSENNVSPAVLQAIGGVLTNKYSEGLAGKRYYQGNNFVDEIEKLALERAKKLFKVPHVNVQAHSGSPANAAVYFALLNVGDKIMGLQLNAGGHLTHGHPKVTFSGKYFETIQYGVDNNGHIDFNQMEALAIKHKPKIIVSGTTAYPRALDFKKFGKIAKRVGAWHLADISHIAGLVATGEHMSPVEYADVVMFTTHKTLRGPRGAVLLVTEQGLIKDPDLGNKIDKAVFPGLQGGPHNNITAAIAVALKEAATPKFKKYTQQIIKNSQVLAQQLTAHGFNLVSGGTDNHLILIDLNNKSIDGWCAGWALEYAGIIVNRNSVPHDIKSPFYPSGIRLGTPILTTRGMKEKEMKMVADWIHRVISIAKGLVVPELDAEEVKKRQQARREFKIKSAENKEIKKVSREVTKLCVKFPMFK